MRTIQMGAIYLITMVNNFFALNLFPFVSASSSKFLGFKKYPTKIQVRSAVRGIIMLLQRESKKSRKSLPKIVISLNAPCANAEGIPSMTHNASTIKQQGILPKFVLSLIMDTTVSISETDDVKAAKKTRAKNTVAITCPPAMPSKTLGNVINISPGPALRLSTPPPNVNTAGIIISPAKKAIPVSKISIW